MHLHEVFGWPGPMTHRQYVAWHEWLNQQWDRPSRADHYAMQIHYELCRTNAKKPKAVKFKNSRLKFREEKSKGKAAITKEQAVEWSKAKWLGLMTMPVKKVNHD